MKSFSHRAQSKLIPVASFWLIFASLFLLSACKKQSANVYRVPKEKPEVAAANPHGQMPHGQMDTSALPHIEYKAPEGWQEAELGTMRAAHFSATGKNGQKADISAIALPGATAPTRDIVNMWREQMKLKPSTDADGEKVAIGSSEGQLFDLPSSEPLMDNNLKARVIAAILRNDQTIWVFKMAGESEAVGEQKPAFLTFLKSIRFTEPTPTASAAPATPAPQATSPEALAPQAPPQRPTWDAPTNWKEQPATQMLLAKYVVTGDEKSQAEITVSAFPGDVGGLLANVNRWRGQLGLAPIEEPELSKQIISFDVLGGKATLVELNGTNPRSGQKARLLGAIVPRGQQTWFYKMMGDEQLAAREKDAFIKFVQSVRYPNAG